MTYKFLNTIIDDLFAFVINMPLLHRLSVFRDDVVFLVYLYQRWIYRVDKTRTNEFGWSEEVAAQKEAEAAAAAAAAAGADGGAAADASEGTLLEDKATDSKGGETSTATQRKGKGSKKGDAKEEGTAAAGAEDGAEGTDGDGAGAEGSKKDK